MVNACRTVHMTVSLISNNLHDLPLSLQYDRHTTKKPTLPKGIPSAARPSYFSLRPAAFRHLLTKDLALSGTNNISYIKYVIFLFSSSQIKFAYKVDKINLSVLLISF